MVNEPICVSIPITDDAMVEDTESFLVNFISSDRAYLSGGPATVFILDNEGDK